MIHFDSGSGRQMTPETRRNLGSEQERVVTLNDFDTLSIEQFRKGLSERYGIRFHWQALRMRTCRAGIGHGQPADVLRMDASTHKSRS